MERSAHKEGHKAFFEVLGHDVRRRILLHLYDRVEMSYTELLHVLKISEGTLNFHLRKMAAFIYRTEKGTYILSEKGKMAVRIIYMVGKEEHAPSEISLLTKKPLLSADVVARRVAAFLIDSLIFFIFTGVFFDPFFWDFLRESALHLGQTFALIPGCSIQSIYR